MKKYNNINYNLTKCYKSRVLKLDEKPKFKLNAYCINLKDREINMEFIHSEWKDFLNIERFIALSSATKSHIQIFKNIWNNKDNINFPIVIIEDDVYRKNNFTKYWNELLNLTECDYIAFDVLNIKFSNNQSKNNKYFISLKEHRAMGFNVYYKKFFDRFNSLKDLDNTFKNKIIDTNFTYNPLYIKYTPKEQVCCQIVSKMSTTANRITDYYIKFYKRVEKKLRHFI